MAALTWEAVDIPAADLQVRSGKGGHIGVGKNPHLMRLAESLLEQARAQYRQTGEKVREFGMVQ